MMNIPGEIKSLLTRPQPLTSIQRFKVPCHTLRSVTAKEPETGGV
jgi:hypothetical protein